VINRYGFNSQGADKVKGYLSNYSRIYQGRGSGDTLTTIADDDMMDEEDVKNEQEMENEQEKLSSNVATASAVADLFEKISPHMTLEEMEDVANVVIMETGTDGMIVTNTTNARPEILPSKHWKEIGGLLGAPLKINPRNAFAPCTNLPMAKSQSLVWVV
jgi:dihydroorotate dehydrogenase